jgi:hypothetical protein
MRWTDSSDENLLYLDVLDDTQVIYWPSSSYMSWFRAVSRALLSWNVASIYPSYHELADQQAKVTLVPVASRRYRETSPWADAIGPLYSLEAIAAALDIPSSQVNELTNSRALFSLDSSEGNSLFPVAQITREGDVVKGLSWILRQLDPIFDRYSLAAWFNRPSDGLEGRSVWEVLAENSADIVPSSIRALVSEARSTNLQELADEPCLAE